MVDVKDIEDRLDVLLIQHRLMINGRLNELIIVDLAIVVEVTPVHYDLILI